MKLITIRSQIQDVAGRWAIQYYSNGERARDKKILQALLALNTATATAEDVAAIIGNPTWVCPQTCSECKNEYVDAVVEVGEEPNYGSNTAWLCRDCLIKALALMDSATGGEEETGLIQFTCRRR